MSRKGLIRFLILSKIFLATAFCIVIMCYSTAYAQKRVDVSGKDNLVLEINQKYSQGNWTEGKELTEKNLKKSPKDSDLKMLLGKYYVHVKQYDKARYELNKSLEYNPANVDAKQLLVGVETETQRYSSAICYVNELLEVNPYWKGLWRKKIELYRKQGNNVEADRLLERISQIYPNDSTIQRDLSYQKEIKIIEKRKEGDIKGAIRQGENLINSLSSEVDHFINLIDNYIKVGDYTSALATSDRAIYTFPGDLNFIHKKASILEVQNRYDELLSFYQSEIRKGYNIDLLNNQYRYYLLEAARNAKDKDPASLYGKILAYDAGNEEAFKYVFNYVIAQQQYQEALSVLNNYRSVRGNTKELMLEEREIYRLQGNSQKYEKISRELFALYPQDTDLREDYVIVVLKDAQRYMQEERYEEAISKWREVLQFGDNEMYEIARKGSFNAFYNMGKYNDALNVLNEMIINDPSAYDNYIKRADLYLKMNRTHNAASAYESLLVMVNENDKEIYLSGYEEMMMGITQQLVEDYEYTQALEWIDRWLTHDPTNKQAFRYAVNFSHKMKKYDLMEAYSEQGRNLYPDESVFKLKEVDSKLLRGQVDRVSWNAVYLELQRNLYHEPAINTFSDVTLKYADLLRKEGQLQQSLGVLDTALAYDDQNKDLKYMKGLVFEKLHQYDSAYYYQSYYEPSLKDYQSFLRHLDYLSQKGYRNNIGLAHLRSRYGDDYAITSVSTVEFSHLGEEDSYTARVNYAGRENGRGMQGQVEWSRIWTEKTHTRFNLGLANRFFNKITLNGFLYHSFKQKWEAELGLGYRRLYENDHNLTNLLIGASHTLDNFQFVGRFNNFLLNEQWLYNLSAEGRYYTENPKNYLLGTAGIGSSPDVELLDKQFYSSFSVVNVMVGAGFGRMITKNISGSLMGTWYNFKGENTGETNPQFRNLYNLYFQLNVAF